MTPRAPQHFSLSKSRSWRHVSRSFLRKHLERFRALGFWAAMRYYLFGVVLHKAGVTVSRVLCYPVDPQPAPTSPDLPFSVLRTFDELGPADRQAIEEFEGQLLLNLFVMDFAQGHFCVLARWNGRLAAWAWIKRSHKHAAVPGRDCWLLFNGATLPEFRGRRILSSVLQFSCRWIRENYPNGAPILAETLVVNVASLRAILRAGFVLVGTEYRLRKWRRYRPLISVTEVLGSLQTATEI